MIEQFKRFRTWWQGRLRKVHDWNIEHAMQRKLIICGVFIGAMAGLLIGTQLQPQTSKFTDTSLNNPVTVLNNDGIQLSMTSRQYNPDKHFMVIKFNVSSSDGATIDLRKIKFKLAMINPQSDVKYTVIPLANNQMVVTIQNLESGYRAIRLTARSTAPDAESLQVTDSDSALSVSSSSTSSASASATASSSTGQFTINESQSFYNRKLKLLSQKDYAISSLKSAIKTLQARRKNQEKMITAYQAQIQADQQNIKTNDANAKYQVVDSSSSNQNSDEESDIKQQQDNIKTTQGTIKKIDAQIRLYRQQIKDIRSGTYKFQVSSTTQRLR